MLGWGFDVQDAIAGRHVLGAAVENRAAAAVVVAAGELELKIKHASGQLKETHKIREIRRSIAQLKTLNKEQEAQKNNDG